MHQAALADWWYDRWTHTVQQEMQLDDIACARDTRYKDEPEQSNDCANIHVSLSSFSLFWSEVEGLPNTDQDW